MRFTGNKIIHENKIEYYKDTKGHIRPSVSIGDIIIRNETKACKVHAIWSSGDITTRAKDGSYEFVNCPDDVQKELLGTK